MEIGFHSSDTGSRSSDPGPALLPESVFREAVACLPLVSIDLLVEDAQGRFLLGRRRNPPAQGWWFVPGGRIRKEERISAALRRLMREELGLEPAQGAVLGVAQEEGEVEGVAQGGGTGPGGPVFRAVHEHFYDTNFANEAGSSTHYVVLVYALRWPEGGAELPLLQHAAYRWLAPEEVLADAGVHAFTKAYFA